MGRKILIIDDDADDRDLFKEALQEIDNDIECLMARNGLEAINLLLACQPSALPDRIFLDLNMPRMGGRQCLAELQNLHAIKNIPVIIFTTSKLPDDREEMKRLGAVGFITKPSRFSELVEQLTLILNAHWTRVR